MKKKKFRYLNRNRFEKSKNKQRLTGKKIQ